MMRASRTMCFSKRGAHVKKNKHVALDGTTRNLSAYNIFVRGMLAQLRAENTEAEQGEHMKRVGSLWRAMSDEDKAKWRAEGSEGVASWREYHFCCKQDGVKANPVPDVREADDAAIEGGASRLEASGQHAQDWGTVAGMSAEERDRYEPTQAQVAEMQGRQKLPVSASVFQSAAGGCAQCHAAARDNTPQSFGLQSFRSCHAGQNERGWR